MSIISCTTDTVQSFQVLNDIPTIPPGGTIGQYRESGSLHLQVGVTVYNVTFVTQKASADYIFHQADFSNSVDDPVPEFTFTISSQTTTGFQVVISANPTTVNTIWNWSVIILT